MPTAAARAEIFCRMIRARSAEHRMAMAMCRAQELPGMMISILQQELDSLIRVVYLLHQTPGERDRLISDAVAG